MDRIPLLVFFFFAFSLARGFILDGISENTVTFYVSPHGTDKNTGQDVNHPIKNLQHVLDIVNQKTLAHKDIVINLLQGYHHLSSTVYVPRTTGRKVTIQAYKDREVHVTGGKQIPSSKFHRVTDTRILHRLPAAARNKVVAVKLSDVGITDFGQMTSIGAYQQRHAPLEVFYNGEPLRLAQWPNEEFINVVSMPAGPWGKKLTYNGDRPSRWSAETDMWAYGYWYWSWSDHSVKIQSIDTHSRTITLANSPNYGLRVGHYNASGNTDVTYAKQGGYFRVINVLAELDIPGEYYVDRTSGILYLWPPTGDQHVHGGDIIYASLINNCIVLGQEADSVTFKGFTLEACRQFGIVANHAKNLTLESMEVKNTGSYNFMCHSCESSTVTKSYFHDGDGGISINGGQRSTLTPSKNVISDNRIWRFARVGAVGYHGILTLGVGSHVHHNHIYFGQYTGIWWGGNDHLIEYNHVHHMCMNSSDCGALHTGRDWTWRGNVIRKNYIHHALRYYPGADVRGIMLDDQYSSVLIENNVFFDNEIHVNIGGGRDNIVRENIFYNATKGAMQVDSRGIQGTNNVTLERRLHSVPYHSHLWATKYPKLAAVDINTIKYPAGNEIYRNVFYDTTSEEIVDFSSMQAGWFNVTNNARAIGPQDFYGTKNYDFRPTCFLSDALKYTSFTTPVSITQVGPRYQIGPNYLHLHPTLFQSHLSSSHACPTNKPNTNIPRQPYLTDGSSSGDSHLTASAQYHLPKEGCWMRFDHCPNRKDLEQNSHSNSGFHRDTDGEKNHHAGTDQTACLERVPHYVSLCGANSSFTVVYGPTGAMTLGGEGCFFAEYGCLKHGGSSSGRIFRDGYAERTSNAAHVEKNCLSRAYPQFVYCGNDANHPVTSIYRPTGHSVTVGVGCWIKIPKCPSHPNTSAFFYDAWGATNVNADLSEPACFDRAKQYWNYCGSNNQYPVTADFRPSGRQQSYP